MSTESKIISISLVIKDAIFRSGLESIIRNQNNFKIEISKPNVEDIIFSGIKKTAIDICILDLNLHHFSTAYKVFELQKFFPFIKVIFITNSLHIYNIKKVYFMSGNGIISKYAQEAEIIKAIENVYDSGHYYGDYPLEDIPKNNNEIISEQEMAVLQELCTSKDIKKIAGDLNMSLSTLNAYKTILFEKIQVHSREQLITTAYQMGLMES